MPYATSLTMDDQLVKVQQAVQSETKFSTMNNLLRAEAILAWRIMEAQLDFDKRWGKANESLQDNPKKHAAAIREAEAIHSATVRKAWNEFCNGKVTAQDTI